MNLNLGTGESEFFSGAAKYLNPFLRLLKRIADLRSIFPFTRVDTASVCVCVCLGIGWVQCIRSVEDTGVDFIVQIN